VTSTDAPGSVLAVDRVGKQFGSVTAVQNLTFRASPGQVTGFLGPNGAGKTTTLRMLVGLVRPTSGAATIGGVPYRALPDPMRAVGSVLDDTGFIGGRTARNHLRVVAIEAGVGRERVDEVVGLVGLADAADRKTRGFSLGMRQRLHLATALLTDPRALILDEPANGLDPEGIAWLRNLLRWLADDGRTVLVSSHLLSEIAQVADHVVVLNRGRLVASSSLPDLLQGQRRTVVVRSPRSDDLAVALGVTGPRLRRIDADTLEVADITAAEVGDVALRAGVAVHELREHQPDLEQVFLDLVAADDAGRATS
jgi:ABC-2 type transport system ATP-binding protein